ncbi:MAG: thiamine-phosphate kinase [Candidatus Eisenbacteria bacterium]
MDDIIENVSIDAWAGAFGRDPRQVNAPHESDAELVELPGRPDVLLAATIDTVSEEILEGLYRDPYTMGWVVAMASLSDLAAVGADAIGLLLSVSVPPVGDVDFVPRAALGVEEACRSLGVHVLGGDSNQSATAAFTGCALGTVPRDSVLTRRGVGAGDAVYLSGRAGSGNALGLARLGRLPDRLFPEERYRPSARLPFGRALRGLATGCMDTSDGVLATLDQLMRLNGLGFEVDCDWTSVLAPAVLDLCDAAETPYWMMLGGPHGEFELAFTMPESRLGELEARLDALDPAQSPPVRIGRVQERQAVTLALPTGERRDVDMASVRNLMETVDGDLSRYVAGLRSLGRELGLER